MRVCFDKKLSKLQGVPKKTFFYGKLAAMHCYVRTFPKACFEGILRESPGIAKNCSPSPLKKLKRFGTLCKFKFDQYVESVKASW